MEGMTMRLSSVVVALLGLLLAAPAALASITFTGDMETGDLAQWNLRQFCSGAATVYSADSQPGWPAPAEGAYALQLAVPDSNVLSSGTMNCAAASGNPRAQIASNRAGDESLAPGDDKWESWYVLIPTGFPSVSGSNWFVLQQDYGAPFSGSPPVAFDIKADVLGVNHFMMDVCHDSCGGVATAWSGPAIQPDHWYHFVVHKVFSTSDTTGSVEIWLDGERQAFVDGSTVYQTRTLHANCTCSPTDAYRFYLNNYRADALTSGFATVYFDGARVGTSREDVDPTPPPEPDATPTGEPDATPPPEPDATPPPEPDATPPPEPDATPPPEPNATPPPPEPDATPPPPEPDATPTGEPDATPPPEPDATPPPELDVTPPDPGA
jgi:hypothetical protein